jgi:hypothetical protein
MGHDLWKSDEIVAELMIFSVISAREQALVVNGAQPVNLR